MNKFKLMIVLSVFFSTILSMWEQPVQQPVQQPEMIFNQEAQEKLRLKIIKKSKDSQFTMMKEGKPYYVFLTADW